MKRFVALLLGLLGLGLIFAAPAAAHATVVTADPADGSRLKAAPHTVTIVFDENVGLGDVGYLHVTSQSGKRVDARAAYHPGGNGTKVADDLQSGLGDGTYTASFRVVSADSHPVAGTIRFVVGTGPLVQGSVGSSSTTNAATGQAFDVARWISYAGLALLGGFWLILAVWPAGRDDLRTRRIIWAGWGSASLGALLELLLQGPYSSGGGLGKVADWGLLDGTLHTNYGELHCLRLVLLGAVAVLLARSLQPDAQPVRWEAAAGGALALGVAWTFSDTGHAATTSPTWISIGADMLHLLSMATWLGGLVLLLGAVLPRREPDELRSVLPTFSRVAMIAVCVLAATGTYAAFRGIGTVDAVFTTTYGVLVVAKASLLVAILLVANLSRRLVQRRTVAYAMSGTAVLEETETLTDVATERLRRSVFVEAVVAFAVLALTALLVAEPRGKEALQASYRNPVSATAPLGGGRTLSVTADPGVHGPVNVTVSVDGGSAPSAITASATQKKAQIGPLPIKLTRESKTTYDGGTTLPVSGTWEIDVVVTSSEFAAVTADVELSMH